MKENIDIFSSNLINKDINNNVEFDTSIKKLQQNLFHMGFDILMINKIISYFNITTESEAIDYLIKDENGMWNHPFVPKEKFITETDNSLLKPQKLVMTNVYTKIKSSSVNEQFNSIIKIDNDICDICEESIDFHKIKKYEIKNSINANIDNKNKDLINFENKDGNEKMNNKNKNILIDDEEEPKEEKKEEEEEKENPNECPICMGSFENPLEVENCKHKFCFDCFNSYLDNLITRNNIEKIPCPKNKCTNDNLSEDFFSQYLSEEQYFKYRQFKSKNEIARDPKKIFCPHCDSYAQLSGIDQIPDPNSPNYVKSTLKCQNAHEFCSCGRPIHEGDCFQDEQEFKELIISEKIKKSPKCGFFIKKNNGCNHMTCGNPLCKYEFCWLCMNEAVPNHYDYGPCAGKQFFDPDSFQNRLRETHPRLYRVVSVIMVIFGILNFIVSFILFPAIGLSIFSYFILYVEEEDIIRNRKVKFVDFLICICISLCSQSLVYMFWILTLFGIALSLVVIPVAFIGLACWYFLFAGPNHNNEPNMIELENSFDGFDDEPHDNNSVVNNSNNENNNNENNNEVNN